MTRLLTMFDLVSVFRFRLKGPELHLTLAPSQSQGTLLCSKTALQNSHSGKAEGYKFKSTSRRGIEDNKEKQADEEEEKQADENNKEAEGKEEQDGSLLEMVFSFLGSSYSIDAL